MEADEKKCPQCAEIVKAEAKVCRFCGHSFENDGSYNPHGSALPKKGTGQGKGCLVALGILLAFVIIVSLFGSNTETTSPSNTAVEDPDRSASEAPGASVDASDETSSAEEGERTPSVGLFGPQANAARSAQQYLNMTGFSRRGLIEQLSSDAGNGYDVADATAAVDSLDVDWNKQAARSAKQYLEMTGFSCSGLVEQLSSDAGSKYTRTQARYGAEQAGAC